MKGSLLELVPLGVVLLGLGSLALVSPGADQRPAPSEALGDIGDTRSFNIISVALRDPDPEVRQRAAEILDQLSDDALFHTLHPAQ